MRRNRVALYLWVTLLSAVAAGSWGQPADSGDQYVAKIRRTVFNVYEHLVELTDVDRNAVVLLSQGRPRPLSDSESMVLLKLDPAGGLIWSTPVKPCGQAGASCEIWETGPKAITTGRSGFMAVGRVQLKDSSDRHLFIAHFTDAGNFAWFKVYDVIGSGSKLRTEGVDIVYLGDPTRPPGPSNPDEFMVVGEYNDGTKNGALIFRIDGKGNLLGAVRRYLGQGSVLAHRLRRTRTQGILLLGVTRKAGEQSFSTGWILQLDPTGLAGWERFYFSDDPKVDMRLADIAEGTNSLMAVAPYHLMSLEKSGSFAAPGTVRWASGVSWHLFADAIMHAIDSHEFVFLPAQKDPQLSEGEIRFSHFVIAGGFVHGLPLSHDAWLAKLDESGKILWQKSYPRDQEDDSSGFINVVWSLSGEILAGGSYSRKTPESMGLVVSSQSDQRGPKLCGRRTNATLTTVCVRSDEGPKTSESLNLAIKDWTVEPGPQIRVEDACPLESGR